MENLLTSFYAGGTKVNVVLSPERLARAASPRRSRAPATRRATDYPVLTGQDADQANVLNIIAGKQSTTIFKDTRKLADQVAAMVEQIVNGDEVEVNDTETYDNGVKVVPSYLLDAGHRRTTDNIESALVDSGYWTADELGL